MPSLSRQTFSRFDRSKVLAVLLIRDRIANVSVGTFSGWSDLGMLDVSSILIATLPLGVFDSAYHLRYLNISNNFISRLDVKLFENAYSLFSLDASGN